MIPGLCLLTLAGLASAALEPRQIMHHVRHQPTFNFVRDIQDRDSAPCKVLSQAYVASGAKLGDAPIVDVPPSVAIACLKSVPLAKERDLALIDYLLPFVGFQSTLETLANPPKEYLFPGVDVLGGIEAVRTKLTKNGYKSQYEFMTDLRGIFTAANDNHFNYPPALLNAFMFVRRGLDITPLSADGVKLPRFFMSLDVLRGNNQELDYRPSAIASIDGIAIVKWLENDAARYPANYQDPDAQFNNMFSTIQRTATGAVGATLLTQFEVPDFHTVRFRNGSELQITNNLIFMPTTDFNGISSGEDFQAALEIPSSSSSNSKREEVRFRRTDNESSSDDESAVSGFPEPIVKHSMGNLAGYFLDHPGYHDTAVLSILSFLPVGFDLSDLNSFNITDFVLEGREVIVEFFNKAKRANRDKLIIDLSANGGGSVALANEIYRLLFPEGEFSGWDRYRANDVLAATSDASYDTLVNVMITSSEYYPIGPDGKAIKTGAEWFGPYSAAGGQNVTAAFQQDKDVSWDQSSEVYYNGVDPDSTVIKKAIFKPKNILVVTDGTCASACGILTGLLTRTQGIRTLALGGRRLSSPMQAMGGVKGTLLYRNSDIVSATAQFLSGIKQNQEAITKLSKSSAAFPSLEDAPLLPLVAGASGGQVNALNGYTSDDLDGYPVHFRYEAANCRLFYTQLMTKDVTEQWRHAHDAAWKGAKCVAGSTSNDDNTIGDDTVAYDKTTNTTQKLRVFAIQWIKLTWLDLLVMALIGGATVGLYHAPIPALVTRTFPITFDSSGDIIYPQWAYPYRGWIIPSWLSGLISIAVPILVYLAAQVRIKSAWDASNAIVGTVWAVILGSVFQVALKQLVGGFRPYFLDVCQPDISLAGERNRTGLDGVGFQQIMYTIDICTQKDYAKLKNAVTSFPSGHSTAAFAGFGFLFLWLNAKLKVWADHKPAFWKLALNFVPLLGAVLICGSLTIDAAHNWYDIVAGAAIGIVMAFAAYRTSYAAVWDWRFNHLPLQQRDTFRYGFDGDVNYAGQTLSGSVGWGAKRDWPHGGLDSAASSTMFARRTSASGQTRTKRRAPLGDEAV
ncbi:hypothetical protein B0J13DRAFT_585706 [Dactylonectria estremocensis]|uniref:Phosphatidic acid phosphatase type 2/haloperoxidase domain-containing protein n=1 Tax=Dactylonectria estremocensis TaxID=1079267 RepID=A0A9P9EQC5_9HYPO|nr:hypothetical protein B0J13DRAFT_585706 [Dactylonectria estremocensis]